MQLYGFALLPEKCIQEKLIRFQKNNSIEIGGPILGLDTNLPHTSILQHPYGEFDYSELIDDLNISPVHSSFKSAYYQPTGWIFADVKKSDEMQNLHDELFGLSKSKIDRSQIDTQKDFSGYTELERKNYLHYGYRYVGKAFRPHITLGRTRNNKACITDGLIARFLNEFANDVFFYDRVVFYEAGEYGALRKVLYLRYL